MVFLNKIPVFVYVSAIGWLGKLLSAVSQLYLIKIVSVMLDVELYVIFLLLVAIIPWFVVADFGVGASLQNRISKLKFKSDGCDFDSLVFNSAVILTVIGFMLIVAGNIFSYYVAAEYLKMTGVLSVQEKIILVCLMTTMAIVIGISSSFNKIYFSLHKGYVAHCVTAFGPVLSVVIFYCVAYQKITLPSFSLILFISCVYSFSNLIVPLINFTCFLIKSREACFSLNISRELLRGGRPFFVFGVLAVSVLQVDYLVASQYLGASSLAQYNLTQKIYASVFFVFGSVLQSLWPVFAEKFYETSYSKLLKVIVLLVVFGFSVIILFSLFFCVYKDSIFDLFFSGKYAAPSDGLILLFCCYFLLRVFVDTFNVILMGIGKLSEVLSVLAFQVFITASLEVFFVRKYGVNGLLIGLIVGFLLTVVWAIPLKVLKHSKMANYENDSN